MIIEKFKMNNKTSIYETILGELAQNLESQELLNKAMSYDDFQDKKTIPLRYRLIALAFMKKMSVEELNDELINNGCQTLYARSSFEATLIYGLNRSLSYKQWLSLNKICEGVGKSYFSHKNEPHISYFSESKVTFGDLEDYVLQFSEIKNGELYTRQITQELNYQIMELGHDYNDFLLFYMNNMEQFSEVREKTRYYFCKYLYYYLLQKIDNYKKKVIGRAPMQDELLGLLPIKAESKLRRRVVDSNRLMEIIRTCSLSPGEIFEEFNYYFFGYISSDWVDICFEEAGSIDGLSEKQINVIASYLRRTLSKKELEAIKDLDDFSLVKQKFKTMEETDYTNRKGEKVIRKYLRGDLDINRTTLVCFLLFFGTSVTSREDIKIDEKRINEILDECGFSMLRKKDSFDCFVITYLKQKDPVSYLMEEMDKYIEIGEPIFLYEMYKDSKSNAKEIRKIMLNE